MTASPTPTSRPSWDETFLAIAAVAARRSTCPRLHVGAVLVQANHVIATGYNGSLPGAPHCDTAGCELVAGHCVRTSHAESNAIAQAARLGTATEGALLYLTHAPCYSCARLAVQAGIEGIVYAEEYGTPDLRLAALFRPWPYEDPFAQRWVDRTVVVEGAA